MIIGLVGPSLSGKDFFIKTILELAGNRHIAVVNTGKLLKQTLNLWGIPDTRKNYSKLPEAMCTAYGDDVFSNVISCEVEKLMDAHDVVIVNALRLLPDLFMIQRFYPSIIVAITTDSEVCFQRAKERQEKIGEGFQTFEEFLEEQQAYTERDIKTISQYSVVPPLANNGTREEFHAKIVQVYRQNIERFLERVPVRL
ncbi:MAG: hypothetical protein U1A25_00300 [Candidatus Sungbacteria bacterium]|nr:hypothetical protein [bacterium]MDZ4260084.1 hypothetical protein [Candidatus Sungbacteria bacterium]